jgi:chloramphenicol O-acetyltransferase type A
MKKIDLSTWHRKHHFEMFNTYEQPFFSACATVDVSATLTHCRENNLSFFICSLFLLGHTANQIEAFRLRINNDDIEVHEESEISCTVLSSDDSFSFCEFGSCVDFDRFYRIAEQKIEQIKQGHKTLATTSENGNEIYCSVLPWLHFTSFYHAIQRKEGDSTPRIVMGKYKKVADEMAMPVSVDVHHALADGLHVGQFFEKLQDNFNHFFGNTFKKTVVQ